MFDNGGEQDESEHIKGTGFIEYWGWFVTLDNLTNNRRELWDYFLDMNIIEFLNTISFYKDKQQWEYDIQQQELQRLKSK